MTARPVKGLTTQARVELVMHRLRVVRVAAVIATALAALLAVLVFDAAFDATVGLPLALRAWLLPEAVVIGLLAGWWRWRRGGALSVERTALWLEEQLGGLQWRVVTAVDASVRGAAPDAVPVLDASLESAPLEDAVRGATVRAVRMPVGAALVAVAVLALLPAGTVGRVTRPRSGDSLRAASVRAAAARDPLARIVVRVTLPSYAGGATTALDDPLRVEALAGSRVRVEGLGDGVRVQGLLNGVSSSAVAGDAGWQLTFSMPSKAAALQLSAGTSTRVLVLDARIDSAPVLVLQEPARDSVLRRPAGRFALRADARDDLGLADGSFELIVSSGSGESFTFRTVLLGKAAFQGEREGALSASLSIDSLGLKPGDVVHLRAVARDRNDVSGPGLGASESRTLRIIRADEYDSVSVEAMPPPETEASALSQRMLLILTQALDKRRRSLAHDVLVREARALAIEQARLRKKVGAMIFERLGNVDAGEEEEGLAAMASRGKTMSADSLLAEASRATGFGEARVLDFEGDETPVMKINRPLLEAYNAMWEATTALEVAQPGNAVAPMQRALAAIERARAAERIYLRGKWPKVVVDIARVRLAGREQGAPAARVPRAAVDRARVQRLARFDAAIDRIASGDAGARAGTVNGARDALLMLRVELLDTDTAAAHALDAALEVMRRGGDATAALAQARRAMAGRSATHGALGAWGTPW